MQLHESTYTYY